MSYSLTNAKWVKCWMLHDKCCCYADDDAAAADMMMMLMMTSAVLCSLLISCCVGSDADGEGEQSEGLFGGTWSCAAVGTEHTGEVRVR